MTQFQGWSLIGTIMLVISVVSLALTIMFDMDNMWEITQTGFILTIWCKIEALFAGLYGDDDDGESGPRAPRP